MAHRDGRDAVRQIVAILNAEGRRERAAQAGTDLRALTGVDGAGAPRVTLRDELDCYIWRRWAEAAAAKRKGRRRAASVSQPSGPS